MKLHRNFIKLGIIFNHHSFEKFKHIMIICVLISYSSKNEKLIWFLLVHNKVLTTYDSDIIFIGRKLHTYDLVLFSSIRFEERYLKQTFFKFFKRINIIEMNDINFTD